MFYDSKVLIMWAYNLVMDIVVGGTALFRFKLCTLVLFGPRYVLTVFPSFSKQQRNACAAVCIRRAVEFKLTIFE